MKTNTDKTNPHAKSISFDSHTNPVLTFIRGECTVYSLYINASNGCIYVGTSAGFCYYNPEKTISSESVLLQAKYRIALKITSEEYG